MRLAVCALSAVLLSGCSWLGGGGFNSGYGASNGAYGYGADCAPGQAASYGYGGTYGHGGGAGCAGGAYGVGQGYGQGYGAGYGADGYGAGAYGAGGGYGAGAGYGGYGTGAYGAGGGYGTGAGGYGAGAGGYVSQAGGYGAGFGGANGFGAGGANGFGGTGFGGANGLGGAGFGGTGFGPGAVGAGLAAQGIGGAGFGAGGYGPGSVTTLGAGAPFGASAYGGNVVGTQYGNGQFVNGAAVQNVVGAPIYVPQPYAAPYGVPQLRGVGAALPFGFEVFGGTEFNVGGDLFPGKIGGASAGGGGAAGAIPVISYADAFDDGYTLGGAATYDISRNTTLIGSAAYSEQEGRAVSTGSFQPGSYDSAGVFVPLAGSTDRSLKGEFSNLEQYTLEGGVRKYVGHNHAFRPYVGAMGGFTYNDDVHLTQTYVDDGTLFNQQEFIDSGWHPTAAGLLGAEMAVGPRGAIGVETGLRWRDSLDSNSKSDDRWSIPVKLRGRVAF